MHGWLWTGTNLNAVFRRLLAQGGRSKKQQQQKAMSRLEFDKHGVPVFNGEATLLEEYQERCWDLFHGRSGTPALQSATPIHLRGGARGIV